MRKLLEMLSEASEGANRVKIKIMDEEARLKNFSPEEKEKWRKDIDLTPEELRKYRRITAKAREEKRLTADEARMIYRILDSWDKASLEERLAVLFIVEDLEYVWGRIWGIEF